VLRNRPSNLRSRATRCITILTGLSVLIAGLTVMPFKSSDAVPFHSSKSDVERLLGKSSEGKYVTTHNLASTVADERREP